MTCQVTIWLDLPITSWENPLGHRVRWPSSSHREMKWRHPGLGTGCTSGHKQMTQAASPKSMAPHSFIVLPQLTSLWPYKRGGGGKGRVFFREGELSMCGGKLQMEGSHLRAGEDGERKSFRWAPGRPLYHEREVAYG